MLNHSKRNLPRPSTPAAAILVAVLSALTPVASTIAATGGAADQGAADKQSLAEKATDPTAALMSFQLNDIYTASFHGVDGTANQLLFRAALPWALAGRQHIFRVSQPYVTSSRGGNSGLGDTQVFDLATFDQAWGRLGVGLVASLPTGGNGLSSDKWTLGPAVGFVNSATKGRNWGLFAQTFFSVAGDSDAPDIGIINLQPIFSYQLGKGRSLSAGNSALIYDTRNSRWASLLLGVNYGQVIGLWGHKWRPNVEVDYDFKDTRGNQEWVFRVAAVLLVPK